MKFAICLLLVSIAAGRATGGYLPLTDAMQRADSQGDNNGKVSLTEFETVMETNAQMMSKEQVAILFNIVDADHDGEITKQELVQNVIQAAPSLARSCGFNLFNLVLPKGSI